jgi:hypothetical protein
MFLLIKQIFCSHNWIVIYKQSKGTGIWDSFERHECTKCGKTKLVLLRG